MSPDPVPYPPTVLPAVRRTHLDELRTYGPIAQHATLAVPDVAHGSCTDDVARGLAVDLMHGDVLGWGQVRESAWSGLRYLAEAVDPGSGRFRNFRDFGGRWLEDVGSEDAHGRAILALGHAVAMAPERSFRDAAVRLFERAIRGATELRALHARASTLIGLSYAARATQAPAAERWNAVGARIADSLAGDFDPVAGSATWPWPERRVTYESALIPRALIVAGQWAREARLRDTGIAILDWLTRNAVAADGHLSPVGNDGWWAKDGTRARFDQQPIEAASFVHAAEAAFDATGDDRHLGDAERACAWFMGGNDRNAMVADPERGGCRDGLGADGCNENQGAESTLAWLASVERIRVLRRRWSGEGHRPLPTGVGTWTRDGGDPASGSPGRSPAPPTAWRSRG